MATLDDTIGLLGLFGDPTRVRLITLLSSAELTVADLTAITGLSQSRVSTHLGRLREAQLLRDRRDGNSTHYVLKEDGLPTQAARLWKLLEGQLDDALLAKDRQRCDELVAARESKENWPDAIAGQMERYYSPGRTWEAFARGIVGLLRLGDVLDIGSGDGVITQLIAPRARSVTCLDRSEKIIDAARQRLGSMSNVRLELGDMHELPFDRSSFDQVLLFNSLTYSHSPDRALAEAARVLRPGGAVSVITLAKHSHEEITNSYSHLNSGFTPEQLSSLLSDCGLRVEAAEVSCREKRKPYFEVVTASAVKAAKQEST